MLTEEFKKAVEENDIYLVRIMLKDTMMIDPSFKEFNELSSYAIKNMEGVYDEHDGEILKENSSDWNEEYIDEQMTKFISNFSKERLKLLRDICTFRYRDKMKISNEISPTSIKSIRNENMNSKTKYVYSEQTKGSSTRARRISNQKKIGGGVVVIGTAVAITGIVISETAVIASGIAIGIIGGIVMAVSK